MFSNNIQSRYGTNHWIPFTEQAVNAREKFESNFMANYIAGKVNTEITFNLFEKIEKQTQKPIKFSPEATAVLDAGRELWKYYHKQRDCNVNASFYDIRANFQGRNDKDRMNSKSDDETYNELLKNLREKLKQLAEKIEPKVYEYGFLK